MQPGKAHAADDGQVVVRGRGLGMRFGARVVLQDIDIEVRAGEVLAIVGGSGSGKSTLMRLLAMLQAPTSGTVSLFGRGVSVAADDADAALRRRLGIMFQQGALFGDQTVLQNVSVPLREHTRLRPEVIEQLAMLKIELAGLQPDAAALYPRQLSGGMRKRAAVARGIALDPDILFLDEPSSGLDPLSADAMDELVLKLRDTLRLTVVLITHDMDSLWRVADRIALLADARVAACGSLDELLKSDNDTVRAFFYSRRGRAAGAAHER
ncbi:MAG TPA: ATP-binding cassette domain-containing protein [Woeseiaceae bacterium]|nr:ATP-binding cassette domain-containing protein [Woeseiaceae bacterium]